MSFHQSPSATSAPRRRSINAAKLWWLGDTVGAVLFAGCLAAFIASWTAQSLSVQGWWLLAGIGFSGLLRAGAQALAGLTGQQTATHAKSVLRGRVMGALLPSGHRVVQIAERQVSLERDGQRTELAL